MNSLCIGHIYNDRLRISRNPVSFASHINCAAAARNIFDYSRRGQDGACIHAAQVNGRAVPALPHSGIAGDAADRTADGHFAAIHIDCAAIDVLNL